MKTEINKEPGSRSDTDDTDLTDITRSNDFAGELNPIQKEIQKIV